MRPKLLASVFGAALIGVLSATPVVGASNDIYPVPLEDFTVSADSCGFAVSGHYLSGFMLFIDHYNNAGDIVLAQVVAGDVKVELTNLNTTKSVVLNNTGPVWVRVYSLDPVNVVPMYNGPSLGWGEGWFIQRIGHVNEFNFAGDNPGRVIDVCALLAP